VSYSPDCQAGDVAELAVSLEAVKRGITVFNPFGHSSKVDLIFLVGNKPVTVQVKKAEKQKNGSYRVRLRSNCRDSRGNQHNYYEVGDFDVLAVHIAQENAVALYRLEEIKTKSITWKPSSKIRDNWELITG
jgi:hypothetical protein